jgi:SSS family solute:Na+ symporter
VRKYVGKVEHFLVAGREMNVYLGIASLAATEFGIVTCMYCAQQGHDFGFAGTAPGIIWAVVMFTIGKTGFCIRKLRDSGVVTLPELFERQYGKKIRWLAGVVIFLGGLLNMGVFLRMGGEFLVYACGLNARYLVITMTVLLVAVAVYTIMGGMLSVLVTDYMQYIVMSVGLIAVTLLILHDVGWGKIVAAVESHYGAAGFNPFINHKLGGWSFIIFNIIVNSAAILTWQTTIARVLAAKDAKTGMKVYTGTAFYFIPRFLVPALWGMAALAVLPAGAVVAGKSIQAMPMFLSQHVPIGLMGLMIAAMLAADMSTDSSYMLTWGSILYNDIMGPFRKGWSEKRGLMVNRMIIAGIGLFLFWYGLVVRMPENMWSYITITGTIYLSSMSILMIACCYWKRANSWGAAGSILFGSIIPLTYVFAQQIAPKSLIATALTAEQNGIIAFACSGTAMVVGSLLKPRPQTAQSFEPKRS